MTFIAHSPIEVGVSLLYIYKLANGICCCIFMAVEKSLLNAQQCGQYDRISPYPHDVDNHGHQWKLSPNIKVPILTKSATDVS